MVLTRGGGNGPQRVKVHISKERNERLGSYRGPAMPDWNVNWIQDSVRWQDEQRAWGAIFIKFLLHASQKARSFTFIISLKSF